MNKSMKIALAAGAIAMMLANPVNTFASSGYQYQVKPGDSFFKISQQHNISMDRLMQANNANQNTVLMVGDRLIIPSSTGNFITYTVKSGDTLWKLSQSHNTTVANLAALNGLSQNAGLIVGQTILIPTSTTGSSSGGSQTQRIEHTVQRGESLWIISNNYGVPVSAIRTANGLTSDTILVGQRLIIPTTGTSSSSQPSNPPAQSTNQSRVTYINYVVQRGDDLWNISIKHGIPMKEVLDLNGLTERSIIHAGQTLRIPVYHIPVKSTVSSRHGEYLDWWTEAQYLFPIGAVAKVTDFDTGRSFNIKRTLGAFHADCEPLTANDARIMKEIWGNQWSWSTRAVIVEANGRRIAASASAMPHDVQQITNNNFNGHFDIHFLNSTRHKDNRIDQNHQAMIRKAAGVQ